MNHAVPEARTQPKAGPVILRRIAIGFASLISAVLISGSAYEAIASTASARRYPPPGELAEVKGRAMHLHCTGEGSPTVVLEGGMSGGVLGWAWVQPEVAKTTRVCSYDRPGYGWSDPTPDEFNASTVADDLHALLAAAGEQGPFVLVGHSLGAHYNRVFTQAHPQDVSGVVLVDARHPAIPESTETYEADMAQGLRMMQVAHMLSRFGVMRLLGDVDGMLQPLPDGVQEVAIAHNATSRHLRTYIREMQSLPVSDALAASAGDFGDRPLIVLSAGLQLEGMSDSFWGLLDELQEDLTTLSTDSERIVVPKAHHVSIVTERQNAQVVSSAIRSVVEKVRSVQ